MYGERACTHGPDKATGRQEILRTRTATTRTGDKGKRQLHGISGAAISNEEHCLSSACAESAS